MRARPQRPRLIVNADDFGFTPAVTSGILEAHAAGAVTSTSMMVHCPGWDDGVRQAKAAPALGVGLHLNLLVGAPLTAARSLADARSGRFLPLGALVRRALLGRIDAAEVAAECEAQLAALRGAAIACTHIDSHRHTHALPVIRGAVAAIASRLGLPLRRPVESHFGAAGGPASHLHRAVIGMSWRATSVGVPPTRAPDHFAGVSIQGADRFAEQFVAAIDGLAPGSTEVMVHPGRVDRALEAIDSYTWQRERELAAFVSPLVRERLRRDDVELIGFRAL
jgi:chitin disaccharide deacetylase